MIGQRFSLVLTSRPRRVLLAMCLALVGLMSPHAHATDDKSDSATLSFDQALRVLDQWLGMWIVVERHFDPSGNVVGETKGSEEVRPILDWHGIRRIYRSAGTSATYEAEGTFTWSEASSSFKGFWIDNQSTNGFVESQARWDADTRTMIYETRRAKPGGTEETYRIVERFIDDEHRQATTYRLRGKQLTKLLEVNYRRSGPCPEQQSQMRIIYDGLE